MNKICICLPLMSYATFSTNEALHKTIEWHFKHFFSSSRTFYKWWSSLLSTYECILIFSFKHIFCLKGFPAAKEILVKWNGFPKINILSFFPSYSLWNDLSLNYFGKYTFCSRWSVFEQNFWMTTHFTVTIDNPFFFFSLSIERKEPTSIYSL